MFEFVRVEDEFSPLYPEVWEIYSESFPIEEQRSLHVQHQAWSDPGYEFLAIMRKDEVIGLLAVWHLSGFLFMEHLALAPSVRGLGIGSSLVQSYLDTLDSEEMVVLEIDPLIDEVSHRRAEFYKRLGFKLTDHQHVQFPFRKEDMPLVLRIMSYPTEMTEEEYQAFNNEYVDRVMNFTL